MRRKPKEICSYTSECQGDKSRVISLSKKEGILRGVGIFSLQKKEPFGSFMIL